jgi:hypothetical protein
MKGGCGVILVIFYVISLFISHIEKEGFHIKVEGIHIPLHIIKIWCILCILHQLPYFAPKAYDTYFAYLDISILSSQVTNFQMMKSKILSQHRLFLCCHLLLYLMCCLIMFWPCSRSSSTSMICSPNGRKTIIFVWSCPRG